MGVTVREDTVGGEGEMYRKRIGRECTLVNLFQTWQYYSSLKSEDIIHYTVVSILYLY